MADKVYILSDGETEIVPPGEEQVFFKELEENGLTAKLIEPESGNQTSSTEITSKTRRKQRSASYFHNTDQIPRTFATARYISVV